MNLPFFQKISLCRTGISIFCIGNKSRQNSSEYSFATNKVIIPASTNSSTTYYVTIEDIYLSLMLTNSHFSTDPFISFIVAISNGVCQKDTFQTLPANIDDSIIAQIMLPLDQATIANNNAITFRKTKDSFQQFFVPIVKDLDEYQQKTIKLHCYAQGFDGTTQTAYYINIDNLIEKINCTVVICDNNYITNSWELF